MMRPQKAVQGRRGQTVTGKVSPGRGTMRARASTRAGDTMRTFHLHAQNGQRYEGVEFSNGQICINHPDDPDIRGLSFSLYDDIAHPLRTHPVFRDGRVEYSAEAE